MTFGPFVQGATYSSGSSSNSNRNKWQQGERIRRRQGGSRQRRTRADGRAAWSRQRRRPHTPQSTPPSVDAADERATSIIASYVLKIKYKACAETELENNSHSNWQCVYHRRSHGEPDITRYLVLYTGTRYTRHTYQIHQICQIYQYLARHIRGFVPLTKCCRCIIPSYTGHQYEQAPGIYRNRVIPGRNSADSSAVRRRARAYTRLMCDRMGPPKSTEGFDPQRSAPPTGASVQLSGAARQRGPSPRPMIYLMLHSTVRLQL